VRNGSIKRAACLPELTSLLVPTFAAALAVSVKVLSGVLDRSLVPGFVCALIITALIMWFSRAVVTSSDASFSPDAIVAWVTQMVCVAVVVRGLGVTLIPRIRSSDFGGHAGLVTWITEHGGLPTSDRWPVAMSNYPPGSHVLPAAFAWITGRSPLEMLWLVAVLGAVSQWPLLVMLTRALSRTHSWWVGLSVLMFVFGTFRLTVGMISADFFFAQMMGQWMALASVTWTVLALRQRLPVRHWVPGVAICAAGSFVAYPQVSVVAAGAVAVGVAAMPMKRRTRALLFVVPVVGGLIGLLALSRTVYWSSQLLAGSAGATIKPSVRVLGGPVILATAAAGLVLMTVQVRRDRFIAPVIGALLGPFLVIAAMLSLRAGFPVKLAVSDYRVVKNTFAVVPYATVAAAVAGERVWLWLLSGFRGFGFGEVPGPTGPGQHGPGQHGPGQHGRRRGKSAGIAVLVASAVVVSLLVVHPLRSGVRPIYDRQAYELGRTLPERQRQSNLGLAGPWVEVAVMRWAGIGPLVTDARPVEFPRSNQWKRWPDSSVAEDFLLVSGPFVAVYAKRPGVKIVKRRGAAVLLTRTE
jgi:hypothetical protein